MTVAPRAQMDSAQPRRWLVHEVWLVFALSLGAAGVHAAIEIVADVSNALAGAHEEMHDQQYGHQADDEGVELKEEVQPRPPRRPAAVEQRDL